MNDLRVWMVAACGAVLAACSGGGASGVPAALAIDVASQAFGTVTVGDQSGTATFTITNEGGAASGLPGVSLGDATSFSIVSSTCTAALPAGGSCQVAVTFAPATAGVHATTLEVAATPGGAVGATLGGTGTATASITLGATGGTVSSDPPGIDCGGTCSAAFDVGSIVLTATADPGWIFTGWSGACAGTGTCTLVLDGSVLEVTAGFLPPDEVLVPAGSFWMGCAPGDGSCDPAESPYHEVAMSAFYVDRTEVTQAAYDACIAAGACTTPIGGTYDPPIPECGDASTGAYPRTCLSADQARAFCLWAGKDLPTEAQWEKAARGTDGRIWPWGDAAPTCELSNQDGCSQALDPADSHPAGASPYGALNMAGNAGEFVKDWYDPAYYASAEAAGPDPQGPATAVYYDWFVLRAGGFVFPDTYNRTSWRTGIGPRDGGWATDYGFRCARAAP